MHKIHTITSVSAKKVSLLRGEVEHYRIRRRTKRLPRCAAELSGLPLEYNADPSTAIIRCTSADHADSKTISKWARALSLRIYRGLQALCLRQSGFKCSKEARRFASSHDAMVESQ